MLKSLKRKKGRDDQGKYIVEGSKTIEGGSPVRDRKSSASLSPTKIALQRALHAIKE